MRRGTMRRPRIQVKVRGGDPAHALCVVVMAATLGCGGKTGDEAFAGAGGSLPFDAGFAGKGGSAATSDGASGNGGTGNGGVAGTGAGAAGSGGESGAIGTGGGGGAGGTGGTGGTGGLGELVDRTCKALIGTSCAPQGCSPDGTAECTIEECRAAAWQSVTMAQRIGCLAEYAASLDCVRANPGSCVSIQCEPAQSRFIQCLEASPRGRCMFLENAGKCSVWCPAWGAACSESPNGLECACGSGPNPDRSFIVPGQCAGDAWIATAEAACG